MNIGLVGVAVAVIGGVLNVLTRRPIKTVGIGLETVGFLLLAIYGIQRLCTMAH